MNRERLDGVRVTVNLQCLPIYVTLSFVLSGRTIRTNGIEIKYRVDKNSSSIGSPLP